VPGAPDAPDFEGWVARIAAGSPADEAELATYFSPRIRAMLRARLRQTEAVHDLAQDTLVAVIVAIRKGQVREAERLPGFVQGVARNLANNHLRGVTRRAEAPFDEALEATLAAPDGRDEEDRLAAVTRGLEAIAPADREVLQLTLVDGLPPRDIAQRLSLSSDVVRTRKSRALMRLRAALDNRPGPERRVSRVDGPEPQ
jgi:RNA polymerase sigma-70 factor (ECF subfamily)